MASNNAWVTSLGKAKRAEDLTRKIYEKYGYIIRDVRSDPRYQQEDVDFVCTNPETNEDFTVESKSDDTYQYGNFAFETVKNTNTGVLGWALTTTADVITIYFPTADIMYVLDGQKTVAWFTENQHRFREITNSTARREGGVLYNSKFRIVPRDLFESETKDAVISAFSPSEYLCGKVS